MSSALIPTRWWYSAMARTVVRVPRTMGAPRAMAGSLVRCAYRESAGGRRARSGAEARQADDEAGRTGMSVLAGARQDTGTAPPAGAGGRAGETTRDASAQDRAAYEQAATLVSSVAMSPGPVPVIVVTTWFWRFALQPVIVRPPAVIADSLKPLLAPDVAASALRLT